MRSMVRVLVLSVLLSLVRGGAVVQLTNENFEHLTQASTGSTTGDWFIDFYAPWCGHCKQLDSTWEMVAQELQGQVNVAKVDVPSNPAIGSRFDVKFFPTLKFLHHGTVYTYDGRRDAESLIAFATGGFKSKEGVPVPPPPTLVESLKKQANEVVSVVKATVANLAIEVSRMARGEKPADPQLLVVFGGVVLVFLLSALAFIAIITMGPPGSRHEGEKEKAN